MFGYFNDIVKAVSESDRVQAVKDWHNDVSGLETGRITRTVIDHPDSDIQSRNGKNDDTIDIILASAVDYAQLFADTKQRAADIANQHEALQNRIQTALASEKLAMDQLLNDAVTLPSGESAFMTENGFAVTLDGQKIDPNLAAGIDWTDKPTLNDYIERKERIETIEGIANEGDKTGLLIGDAQNRLAENPTAEDLEKINIEFDDIQTDIDDISTQLNTFERNEEIKITMSNQASVDLSGMDFK